MITFILQTGKLNLREVKCVAQGHVVENGEARTWPGWSVSTLSQKMTGGD